MYEEMLGALLAACDGIGISADPSSVVTDFEAASMNAVRPRRRRPRVFLRATAVPAGRPTAEARITYGNSVCLSVRPSVTTRYGFKAR